MSPMEEQKRRAAEAALRYLPEAGVVGLGTGSTATHFIDGVGRLVRAGRKLVGVPTSVQSREQALRLGIPLLKDEGPWEIEVTVDGADEVDPELNLIKGGGGAHTREKIVNFSTKQNVIVVDESKLSPRLGEHWPVPVEVLAFGKNATLERLSAFGRVTPREKDGVPTLSDAGNLIIYLHAGPIEVPSAFDAELKAIPGVVETGLFCGRADVVLVASATGVRTLLRP